MGATPRVSPRARSPEMLVRAGLINLFPLRVRRSRHDASGRGSLSGTPEVSQGKIGAEEFFDPLSPHAVGEYKGDASRGLAGAMAPRSEASGRVFEGLQET